MTSAYSRLSRVLLGSAFATALCIPVSAAPVSGEVFVKLPPGSTAAKDDHKNEIEILSWSWGETQQKGGNVEYEWKVEEGESAAAKQLKQDSIAIKQTTHAASGEKGGTEDINIGVGELQETRARANDRLRTAGPKDGWGTQSAGEAEITLKGSTIKENAARTRPSDITLKRGTSSAAAGGVSVAAGDVTGDGTAAASGLPTGKRQHKPMTITMPLDRGSVSLKLKSAWPSCRVGERYSELELGDGAKAYKLQDAVVTSCAPESMSLNYSKVIVRGWDPQKKEE